MAGRRNSEFEGTGINDAIIVDPADIGGSGGTGGGSGGSGGSGTGEDFDPAIHIGRDKLNADGSFAKKRGKRKGTATKDAHPLNLSGIESVLLSVHTMLAAATQSPEIALDEREAKAMTDAIAEVAKHYPMTIDPKTLAWANLVGCMGMVYGPRLYMIRTRKNNEVKEAEKAAPVAFGLVR